MNANTSQSIGEAWDQLEEKTNDANAARPDFDAGQMKSNHQAV